MVRPAARPVRADVRACSRPARCRCWSIPASTRSALKRTAWPRPRPQPSSASRWRRRRAAARLGRATRPSRGSRSARRWGWGGPTLRRGARARRRCRARAPTGRRPGRARRDPLHLRLHRRAQGRRVHPCQLHRAGRDDPRGLRHRSPARSTCRPSRRSRCSTRRLGMTSVIPDMDPDASGQRRSAQADRGRSKRIGCTIDVRLAGAARQPRPPRARRTASTLPACAGCSRPARRCGPDVVERTYRMLRRRRRGLDAVWRHRMPAGRGRSKAARSCACARAPMQGGGICVGRPLAANRVRVIRIDDGADRGTGRTTLEVPPGVVGEITVAGPSATRGYFGREAATQLAKIRDGRGAGAPDGRRRLFRRRRPAVVLRPQGPPRDHPPRHPLHRVRRRRVQRPSRGASQRTRRDRPAATTACRRSASSSPIARGPREWAADQGRAARARRAATRPVAGSAHSCCTAGFPVDIRHNAKIGREQLAAWAARTR